MANFFGEKLMSKEEKRFGYQPGSKVEGGHQPSSNPNVGHQPAGNGGDKTPIPPTIDNTIKKGKSGNSN